MQPKTILILEDDHESSKLLSNYINLHGYNVIVLSLEMQVLDFLKKGTSLDLILVSSVLKKTEKLLNTLKDLKIPIYVFYCKKELQRVCYKSLQDYLINNSELDLGRYYNLEDFTSKLDYLLELKSVKTEKTKKKILLAENYAHSQIALVRILKEAGFKNLVMVSDGEEALKKVAEESFDLLIIDAQMPNMNGFEAIEEIRKIDAYKKTPIIMLAAIAMTGDREKCIESGATDYMPKPVSYADFIKKVNQHL